MMLEFILALLIGVISGVITGLTPGIHINLIAIIALGVSPLFLTITTPLTLALFIVAMAITHTFLDFIPAIFLGAPDEDSFLSILPGHRLLLQGRGYFGVIYTLYGSITALAIIIVLAPFFIYLLPTVYPFIRTIMPIILISIAIYLVLIEGENKKCWAFVIFALAGFLGIATLNLNLDEPLLPLLTGLFGASTLIVSINQKTKIPKQKIQPLKTIKLSTNSLLKATTGAIIASPFTAFLPGLGASQAAILGKEALNIRDQRQFLFLLGAINTIVMGLSFITLYSIGRIRTGAAVAVAKLLPNLTQTNLSLILLTTIISGILAFIITITIAKKAATHIHQINYQKLSIIIITLLLIITIIFADQTITGKILSLLIFLTATSLGIFTIQKKIRRIHLMGCLLIPTIMFYLT